MSLFFSFQYTAAKISILDIKGPILYPYLDLYFFISDSSKPALHY